MLEKLKLGKIGGCKNFDDDLNIGCERGISLWDWVVLYVMIWYV